MISIFYNEYKYLEPFEEEFKRLIMDIVADYKLKIEYLNLVFLSDEGLIDLNKKFLNHDYFTDIITFNYSEDSAVLEAELYISIDRIRENAINLIVDEKIELTRVIAHGILHLAGYDDSTDGEKNEMRRLEDYYIAKVPFHVKPI
jgi:probable rRNA maturation factor